MPITFGEASTTKSCVFASGFEFPLPSDLTLASYASVGRGNGADGRPVELA